MQKVKFDVVGQLPTYDDLCKYGAVSMAVLTEGPGGGNPEVQLEFRSEGDARRYLVDWLALGPRTDPPETFFVKSVMTDEDRAKTAKEKDPLANILLRVRASRDDLNALGIPAPVGGRALQALDDAEDEVEEILAHLEEV